MFPAFNYSPKSWRSTRIKSHFEAGAGAGAGDAAGDGAGTKEMETEQEQEPGPEQEHHPGRNLFSHRPQWLSFCAWQLSLTIQIIFRSTRDRERVNKKEENVRTSLIIFTQIYYYSITFLLFLFCRARAFMNLRVVRHDNVASSTLRAIFLAAPSSIMCALIIAVATVWLRVPPLIAWCSATEARVRS